MKFDTCDSDSEFLRLSDRIEITFIELKSNKNARTDQHQSPNRKSRFKDPN